MSKPGFITRVSHKIVFFGTADDYSEKFSFTHSHQLVLKFLSGVDVMVQSFEIGVQDQWVQAIKFLEFAFHASFVQNEDEISKIWMSPFS